MATETQSVTLPILAMGWTDPLSLAAYPDMVWRPSLTAIDGIALAAGEDFDGYVNLAALEAGASPVASATHHVDVSTAAFLTEGAAAPTGTTNLAVFAGVILAMGMTDPFFATATLTQATVTITLAGS